MGYKLVLLSGVLTHSSCHSCAAPVMLMLRISFFVFYFTIFFYKIVLCDCGRCLKFWKKTAWISCYSCVRCKYAVLSDWKVFFGTVPFASAQPNHIHTRSRLQIKCSLLRVKIVNISRFRKFQWCLLLFSSNR